MSMMYQVSTMDLKECRDELFPVKSIRFLETIHIDNLRNHREIPHQFERNLHYNKIDPVRNGFPASEGSFFWGGLASTLFWVDPQEELVVVFLTQLMPSSTFNFRGQLESIIYAALDNGRASP